MSARPRILLLIDRWGWAFDTLASAIKKHLSDRFRFDILASAEHPAIDASSFDLIHVFYFGERYHLPFLLPATKVLKSVYSYRWQLNGHSPDTLYAEYLREARAITVPNIDLLSLLSSLPVPVFCTPEGVDTALFRPGKRSQHSLVAGWAGNSKDVIKQFAFAEQACKDICEFRVADGSLPPCQMPAFYQSINVLLCTSLAEGSPRPILEAMASGVFPVTFPVGIAKEVIHHAVNGLIVEDRTVSGLRHALRWCADHPSVIQQASLSNPGMIRETRRLEDVTRSMKDVYDFLLV